MKYALSAALLCCLLTHTALAQNAGTCCQAEGVVLDSATRAPLEFVTVTLQATGKDQLPKHTFTDSSGRFKLENFPRQQYDLVLSLIGYETRFIKLPAPSGPVADAGQILLAPKINQLKEVEVVSERALVTYELDKTSYNVAADPDSKTQRTIDILRKVPHLTVDADDNIKLKGNGNFTVLVNGKPSALFARNVKDVFRSMPASSIKSIEVITTPPSRYDAEGISGIINIITHRQKQGGYNGSVNLSGSRPEGYYAGGYITAVKNKFGFSSYYGYNRNTSPDSRLRLVRKENRQATGRLEQQGEKNYEGNFRYLDGEISYTPDSLNLFTANYSTNTNRGNNFYVTHNQVFDKRGALSQVYTQQYDVINSGHGFEAGTDYQRSFRKNKDQLFTLSYKLRTSNDNSQSGFTFIPVLNYAGSLNRTENTGSFREHTFQADYVQPLKKQLAEFGLKQILRSSHSNYYYKSFNPKTDTYELNNALSNLFDYRQDIFAAYASLTLHYDQWGLKTGGRLENTRIRANFTSSGTAAGQDHTNLLPNIIVSRQLKQAGLVKLAYAQRIERPGLFYLNPYQDVIDPKNISFGNPDLLPAISNQLDLTYNTYFSSTSLSASTYYSFMKNAIQRYTITGADGIARSTYGNIGRSNNYGISLSANTDMLEKININVNSSANYVWLSSIIDSQLQSNSGITYDVFGYLSYKFGSNWRVSGNLGYNAPSVFLQGRSGDYFYNSFALNKEILKSKGNLSFNVSNPFRKERRWFNELDTPGFYQFQESYVLNRWFSLTFNYRFGRLEEDMARKKRGIENDDIKAAEKKNDGT